MKKGDVHVGMACPKHGYMTCPICGSKFVELEYRGSDPKMLACMKQKGFRCFVGCKRVELHNKVWNGTNWAGLMFIRPIFDGEKQAVS